MAKRILKYVSLFLLSVFVLLNIVLGYYGVSSIFLTAIVYIFLWVAATFIVSRLIKNTQFKQNLKLLFTAMIVSLFIGELALKYVFKKNLAHQEMNGSFFYSFPYGKPEVENFIRRVGHKEPDVRLSNYVPYMKEIRGCAEFQYLYRYNSIGLRGHDPVRDDTLLINIVGLGDSFTEGVGTPEDSTWLQLLENNLKRDSQHLPGKVQCINGGISGTEAIAEYIILKELLLQFNPRVVILAVNSTDISDVVKIGGWERYNHHRLAPWYAYIYQFSFIARAIIQQVHPVNWLFLTDEENHQEEIKAINTLERCIKEDYVKLSKEQNFKLIVVLHPMLSELEQNDFLLQPLAVKLQSIGDIKTINLFEAFKQAKQQNSFEYKSLYWQQDKHNNSRGYQLWADHTYPQVDLILRDTI